MSMLRSESAFSLLDRLEEFKQFQAFGLSYQHGIKRRRPRGTLYTDNSAGAYFPRRATTFVYAYFVFNAMYIIDWESSIANPNGEPTEWRSGHSEQEKIWRMAKFCLSGSDANLSFFTSKLVECCNALGVDDATDELAKMNERRNEYLTTKLTNQYRARRGNGDEISLRSISDFRESFRALYENGKHAERMPLKNALIHVNNVLYFVYLVRCSVFHGRKQLTIPDIREDQDIRLAVYAAILMAMNQVVIERAEQEVALHRAQREDHDQHSRTNVDSLID